MVRLPSGSFQVAWLTVIRACIRLRDELVALPTHLLEILASGGLRGGDPICGAGGERLEHFGGVRRQTGCVVGVLCREIYGAEAGAAEEESESASESESESW